MLTDRRTVNEIKTSLCGTKNVNEEVHSLWRLGSGLMTSFMLVV